MQNKIIGFIFPVIVLLATFLVWIIGGAQWALIILLPCFVVYAFFHLIHLHLLRRWIASPLDGETQLPEGKGVWACILAELNIREQKHHGRNLQQQRTIGRFRKLAEEIPDGVIVLDKRDGIEWCNDKAQTWLGLDYAKDRGLSINHLIRHPDFMSWLTERPADGETPFPKTILLHAPQDSSKSFALFQLPFGESGRILIVRDVSDYEKAAQLRREFIASISHELKTPLTVIVGFLETIQDMEDENSKNASERRRYLELMQQQAGGMQRLVEDLLILSALESGQHSEEEQWFSSAPFLHQAHENAEALSQGKHEITLCEECRAELLGMYDELASVLTNLLSNAIRYTPQNGKIEIVFSIDDKNRGVITVSDTGIGIAKEHLPRLTERFYRVDRSRSRASGGTGLGLAIVKHVLIQHQAELLIKSTPGKGSAFSVILPAARVQNSSLR
ncbi:MAG: phosphate regulon sensor histidine kinase PhoR [Burkholderiales bacterium]|jgi:two-component system phosphate regulon sensor histidine kinase PhoR|nr:phosphate regulon sensor histidine kinase PhoR [Burkholderiales bacterium]